MSTFASQSILWISLGWAGFALWRVTGRHVERVLESEPMTWAPDEDPS